MKALRLARLMPSSEANFRTFAATMAWDAENDSAVPAYAGFRGMPMQPALTELAFSRAVNPASILEVPRAGPTELVAMWLLGVTASLASWYGLIRVGIWVVSKLSR